MVCMHDEVKALAEAQVADLEKQLLRVRRGSDVVLIAAVELALDNAKVELAMISSPVMQQFLGVIGSLGG